MVIKYALFDVDGTLSSHVIYGRSGISRAFHMRDGHGITMLKENGVIPFIISGEDDYSIRSRAAKLNVRFIHAPDKLAAVKERFTTHALEYMAFMGDDVPDLPLISAIAEAGGFVGCSINAHRKVYKAVLKFGGLTSIHKGGHGCVRDFCETILDLNDR